MALMVPIWETMTAHLPGFFFLISRPFSWNFVRVQKIGDVGICFAGHFTIHASKSLCISGFVLTNYLLTSQHPEHCWFIGFVGPGRVGSLKKCDGRWPGNAEIPAAKGFMGGAQARERWKDDGSQSSTWMSIRNGSFWIHFGSYITGL